MAKPITVEVTPNGELVQDAIEIDGQDSWTSIHMVDYVRTYTDLKTGDVVFARIYASFSYN